MSGRTSTTAVSAAALLVSEPGAAQFKTIL